MNILIIGNGQLGVFLHKNLIDSDVIDYPEFDLTNQEMIKNAIKNYGVIINAAAYTLVDKAESEQLDCYMINSMGPIMLASECIKQGKRLVHISTESVYGSNDSSYQPLVEDSEKHPTNTYAKSKKIADDYLESLNSEDILILRPGWLFGPNNDHNFVEKIRRVILSKEKINVVDDQIGTMSFVGLLEKAISAFIEGKLPAGTYNIGNPEYPSRYDVACFVRDQLNAACIIERCDSSGFKRIADVAKNSCLDCSKLKKFVNLDESWQEDVKKVLIDA